MKKLKMYAVSVRVLVAVCLCLLCSFGCERECNEEIILQLPTYPVPNNNPDLRNSIFIEEDMARAIKEKKSMTYVINSEKEYMRFTSYAGKPLPAIDFNKYTLLAGIYYSKIGGIPISQRVSKHCNIYRYDVLLSCDGCNYRWADYASPYSILVDKLPLNAKIQFNVTYQ